MKRLELWIVSGVLVLATMLILAFSNRFVDDDELKNKTYSITNSWELPDVLEEVSGIAWLGNHEMATVEDEDGTIFIYNLESRKITEKIKFAGPGDYEEILVDGTTAYVLRSDGRIFEMDNFRTSSKEVQEYKIDLFKKSNMEAMAIDKANDRLLLIPKDKDPEGDNYKGIYSFSLQRKKLDEQPILKIDMNLDDFKDFKHKKDYKTLRPSSLTIHPTSGKFYLLEGVNPKLLIFDKNGVLQKIHILDEDEFAQAEGLTFTPEGTMYISNEANDEAANILEVKLE